MFCCSCVGVCVHLTIDEVEKRRLRKLCRVAPIALLKSISHLLRWTMRNPSFFQRSDQGKEMINNPSLSYCCVAEVTGEVGSCEEVVGDVIRS